MKKYVRSVSKELGGFRVSIPRELVLMKLWVGVTHVLVEDHGPDTIIIRRLLDGKETTNEGG